MMTLIQYPSRQEATKLLQRPLAAWDTMQDNVARIINDVRRDGDAALRQYAAQFDGAVPDSWEVSGEEWKAADRLPDALIDAIDQAATNITCFHKAQVSPVLTVETMPGVSCSRKAVAIDRVGLYIPGGTAPLFSTLLMLGIPAVLAGCKEIIVCTPPDTAGRVHPAILYVARKLGISSVYKVGGVQAIAAMALGTETVPRVQKLFGPGNGYVTCAKLLLQTSGVAIDMPAGPSEVAVLADNSCVPEFVAADLLSQAEHGTDSQVLLVCDDAGMINRIQQCIAAQLPELPRHAIAATVLANSKTVLVRTLQEGMDLLNDYAPEHLILAVSTPQLWADQVRNAGSVFLGHYSPESAGDYASGTNHTLPTNGYAAAYSGVSVDSFTKKITFQEISKAGLAALGKTIMLMAEAEGLDAHARAVSIRLA